MSTTFAPLKRRTLTDDVRERLVSGIMDGSIPPGSMLPGEDTLCRQLNVSRTSLREAMRELLTIGLVERRGNRAYVVEHLPEVRLTRDHRADRLRELFETRRAIEIPLTELAAQRASRAQRDQLESLAARIAAARSVDDLRPLDPLFHSILAVAAGNALLAELHGKVLAALFDAPLFDEVLNGPHTNGELVHIMFETARAHAAIATAIAEGDRERAGVAARAHLDEVERRLTARLT
jgi:GntR family transcriptional regulator, transcriptional repressor for pyruvate dehydrogenase complex